ncbi:septal ring lytic transglycosylase RlpA family protein [Salinispora tropica]|uniref:septal ring lytic transglycosylase RlpA family protein n=1 Tax=Salinispora tropica TaxID=168695 RepID=UPI0004781C69|nr:septal ring lytic transglycosylase RlpA family protein [Salinispora tropica]
MAGRHARTRRVSPTGVAATAAIGVVLAIGGTVGTVRLTSGNESDRSVTVAPTTVDSPATAPTTAPATPSASPSVSPSSSARSAPAASPTPARNTQVPSRSKPRSTTPQPTATKSTSPAPTVMETGSCGASYYSEGQLTASGESFDPSAMTAAHKTLPFDTMVRVTNPVTSTSVTVRINDRGPFITGRCIDLSQAAFAVIAPLSAGHVEVRYEVLG